jgi:hypothetical protein
MYWACCQLEPNRTGLALHCLAFARYGGYHPRLREERRAFGRKIVRTPPLFQGYCFLLIISGLVECAAVCGRDVHDNACSHTESLNCFFGRFGNRLNESDH